MSSRQASRRTSADCSAALGGRALVVADQRDADGAGVEAQRVRADHVARRCRRRGPRTPSRSGRRESCSRCRSSRSPSRGRSRSRARSPPTGPRVRVRAGGVVDDRELQRRRVERRRARRSSRRPPMSARVTIGGSLRSTTVRVGAAPRLRPEVVGAQPRDGADVRGTATARRRRPSSRGCRRSSAVCAARPSRSRARVGVGGVPGAPASGERARPVLDACPSPASGGRAC